jgi:hypothetical protein
MHVSKKIALFALFVCAAFTLSGCGGSSKPISIAITSSSSTVDGGDTVTLTVTVTNDKNSAGVSWAITSGGGALSNTSTTSATYTAPAATSSQQSITITATSVAKTTQTGTVTITVPALPAVTTTSANLTGAVGTSFSIKLAASGGIPPFTWTLGSGTTLPACLTLKSDGTLTTANGAAPDASCAGSYTNLTFKATDSGTPNALSVTSAPLTVTITAPSLSFSPTLPGGNVGTAYQGSVAATGVVGASTYTIASGALPADLSLNAGTGAITGTPKASDAGTFTFAIKVVDAYGDTATSGNLSITITAPTLTFPTSLSGGAVGTAYSASVAATGVVGASTYTIASGSIGSDLSLNASTGAITGTPKASDAGTFTFTVKVVDAFGDTATSGTLSIVITAPTITFPTSLSGGTVGTAYSASVAATGVVGASTYTIATGSIGSDLSLDSSTGAITGTPKASDVGTFTFTVKVVDAYGDTKTSGSLSIAIVAPTITFPTSLPGGTVGTAYSGSVAATGPAGATTYSLATGSLGSDLSLNSSTGAITGTPKASDVGTFTFTVKVVDAYGDTATSGSLSITIVAAGAIVFGTAPTATATAGVAYSSALSASGGAGALTYSISTGSLPAGLNLNTTSGAITGTPTTVGPVTFTAKAQDNFGDTPATQSYTITVNPGAATHFAVALTSSSTITAGSAVSFTVTALDAGGNTATGYSGTVAFTSTDANATMPASAGLASGQGSFSATLKTAGSQTITATDTGNATITGTTAAITVNPGSATTLVVTAPATATNNVAFNFTVTAKDAYNNTATGFTDLVHFTSTDSSAVLPPNSGLNGASGGVGNFSATLKTLGSQTITATDAFNGSINGTSGAITVSNTVTIITSSIGPFDSGQTVSATLNASGGSGNNSNYTWSWTAATGSSIPPGLSLSTAGVISGTAGTAGTYNVSVTVKDTGVTPNQTYSQSFTIVINGALALPAPNPSSLPSNGYTGVSYSGSVAASGGSGNYCYSVVTGLPADGLSAPANNSLCGYAAPTFLVSGTPTAAATVTFDLKVADGTGASVTRAYTITITNPTPVTLPAANPSSLPSATVNQAYNGAINASGGVPPFTWSINGTTVTSGGISVGNGLSASSTGGSSLSITGSPTSTGTVNLTNVKVTDSLSSNATQSYTITVNPSGGSISGQVFLSSNYCSSGSPGVTYTVTATPSSGSPTQVTSDSNGNYSFSGLAFGTYTITVSGVGAASTVYYPASPQVTLSTSNSSVTGENFNASVGFNVSGTVSYSGTQTGQTYLYLNNNCGGNNGNPGTSITEAELTTGGAFTIHGVPPGNYTLYARMDSTGITSGTGYPGPQGVENANDPTSSGSSADVTNASVTGIGVTLTNPTYVTPPNNPGMTVIPSNGGVLIFYTPPTVNDSNGNNEEAAQGYEVQWAVSNGSDSDGATCSLGGGNGGQQFGTVAGSHTFYAVGANGATVWILNNTSMGAGTFTAGGKYCFQARSYNLLATTQHPSGWTTPTDSLGNPTATTLLTSNTFCSSNCTAISGTATIPAGVTPSSGAPLYVGIYQQSSSGKGPSAIYATEIASPLVGANSYSMTIPSGSGYFTFGILDQNNDGQVDVGDVQNTNNNNSNGITVSGSSQTGVNTTLPSANSTVVVQTQYSTCGTNCSSYDLNMGVSEANKLPVSVTLYSGPNMLNPVDIGLCTYCGNTQFDYSASLLGSTPNVGDTYSFTVTYSDGSVDQGSAGTISGKVVGWNGGSTVTGASDAPTNLQTSGSNPDQPNFSWTDSSSSTGSNFFYQFYLSQNSNCTGNCTIWQIPGQNSNSNGFSSSITSLTWGTDPTGGGSTPSGSLSPSNQYYWSIRVQDSNGDSATTSTSYTP